MYVNEGPGLQCPADYTCMHNTSPRSKLAWHIEVVQACTRAYSQTDRFPEPASRRYEPSSHRPQPSTLRLTRVAAGQRATCTLLPARLFLQVYSCGLMPRLDSALSRSHGPIASPHLRSESGKHSNSAASARTPSSAHFKVWIY